MESGGSQAQGSKYPLLVESCRMCLGPPARSCDNMWERVSIREAQRDSVSRVFTGSWLHRPFFSGMFQKSRLPEGNHKLHYSDIMGHLYQGMWESPEIQVPKCPPRANLASGPF